MSNYSLLFVLLLVMLLLLLTCCCDDVVVCLFVCFCRHLMLLLFMLLFCFLSFIEDYPELKPCSLSLVYASIVVGNCRRLPENDDFTDH